MTDLGVSPVLQAVGDSYAHRARLFRWDTYSGSKGRCWEITQDFARYLMVQGVRCELAAFATLVLP